MNCRIAIIVPNEKLYATIKDVLKENALHYPIYHKYRMLAVETAKDLVKKGTKVILSIGLTVKDLRDNVNALVIELRYSGLQIALAIKEGLKRSDRIAVVGSKDLIYLANKTIEITELNAQTFEFDETNAFEYSEEIVNQDFDVVISGSSYVCEYANRMKTGILVNMDKKYVLESIRNAEYILKLLIEAEEKYETIKTILVSTSDNIIGTDKDNLVTFMNPAAEKTIGLSLTDAYHQPFAKIMKDNNLVNILSKDKREYDGDPLNKYIVMDILPIVVNNQTSGKVYTIKEIAKIQEWEHSIRKEILLKGHYAKSTFKDIIGSSEIMSKTKKTAMKYAGYDSTVIIWGETGTGKEIFAQSIHNASRRKREAFVAVNCAALPETLLESELFGYVKGAFTGARQDGKVGLFEQAHKGTIFLDEISEISLSMQARLLRVLQEGEITRIGDDKVIPVDVRIISTTNQNLEKLVDQGAFRKDLFYRLCVLELHLPPLSAHLEDIAELVNSIIKKKNKKLGTQIRDADQEFIKNLKLMEWPGNIRQLENFIERVMVMSEKNDLDPEILPLVVKNTSMKNVNLKSILENKEREIIQATLKRTNGNHREAAELLGITTTTLWRKIKQGTT